MVDGFINVDKPQGLTSRAVVDQVSHLLLERGFSRNTRPKVGHVGTLDPLATGVLVVAVGAATRLTELVHEQPKSYRGTFLLGQRSTTDDVTGEVTQGNVAKATSITRNELESALAEFRGRIEQVPPTFSAVRVGGRRAYKLARQGNAVQLKAKTVEIYRLELVTFVPPELVINVECSSGTYIRAIGRDLGEQLGCGAIMSALVRTKVGPFELAEAAALDELTTASLLSKLLPCAAATRHLPAYVCDDEEMARLSRGLTIPPRELAWRTEKPGQSATVAFLNTDGDLVAIGGWDRGLANLRPRINLATATQSSQTENES